MTRVKPTTLWNTRTKPTVTWKRIRDTNYLTWDEISSTWDEILYTWDGTFTWGITTSWTNPRKLSLLELENSLNLELENWNRLLREWWRDDNIIDTVWS